jgi:hypothetical protein
MDSTEYKNDFIESYVYAGFDMGFDIGFELGAVADTVEKLLKVLDVRGLKPTDAQRAQVSGSADRPQLNKWFDRALTAKTAAEVFTD